MSNWNSFTFGIPNSVNFKEILREEKEGESYEDELKNAK